jgi:hypothetical protein
VSARLGGANDFSEEEEEEVRGSEATPSCTTGASSPGHPNCRRWLLDVPVVKRPVRELFAKESDDDIVEAMVGYKTIKGLRLLKTLIKGIKDEDIIVEIQVVSVRTHKRILQQLDDKLDEIEFVEKDDVIEATKEDVVPWGVSFTQAASGLPVASTQSDGSSVALGNCSNPDSFRIGLVDSGIYSGHPDLICKDGPDDPNCVGKSFGTDDPWQVDLNGHGTWWNEDLAGSVS